MVHVDPGRRREAEIYCTEDDPDGHFNDLESQDPDEAFQVWQAEWGRSRELTAQVASLDEPAKRRRGKTTKPSPCAGS